MDECGLALAEVGAVAAAARGARNVAGQARRTLFGGAATAPPHE